MQLTGNEHWDRYLSPSPIPQASSPLPRWAFHLLIRVLNFIDVCQPGSFMPKPACGEEDLNLCSIGIKYNGSLEPGTLNLELRAKLIALLLDLRAHYPTAKILAKDEYDRWHIHVRDDMNQLRSELSNYL